MVKFTQIAIRFINLNGYNSIYRCHAVCAHAEIRIIKLLYNISKNVCTDVADELF